MGIVPYGNGKTIVGRDPCIPLPGVRWMIGGASRTPPPYDMN